MVGRTHVVALFSASEESICSISQEHAVFLTRLRLMLLCCVGDPSGSGVCGFQEPSQQQERHNDLGELWLNNVYITCTARIVR
jgi:hypothetical protein